MTVQQLRRLSVERITACLAGALVLAFFVWALVALSVGVRSALTVFLTGGLFVVISLQATTIARHSSFGSSQPPESEDVSELAFRRRSLDPGRRPVVSYMTMTVALFTIPIIILLGTASSDGGGTPLSQTMTGRSVIRFIGLGAVAIALVTLIWLLLSGPPERVFGYRMTRAAPRWPVQGADPVTSLAHLPPAAPSQDKPATTGDAMSAVDCTALAALLANRLGDALGSEFTVSTVARDSILVEHSGYEQIIVMRMGRFRLEPPPRAVGLASQQVMSDVQRFASQVLQRPWPESLGSEDLRLLERSSSHSSAIVIDGIVRLSWQDASGTIRTLQPFALKDVLVGQPGAQPTN